MNRRSLLLAASGALAFAGAARARPAPRPDPLRAAFAALSPDERRAAQSELRTAGLYGRALDGRYGPATERALVLGAALLEDNSRGRIAPRLATPEGAQAYLRDLAALRLSAWLYGEGDDCDPAGGACG
jgi:hypothetical protein